MSYTAYMIFEIISTVLFGVALIYFSNKIAELFSGSSIIRGADNPWTYKTVGVAIIAYGLFWPLLTSSLM